MFQIYSIAAAPTKFVPSCGPAQAWFGYNHFALDHHAIVSLSAAPIVVLVLF